MDVGEEGVVKEVWIGSCGHEYCGKVGNLGSIRLGTSGVWNGG